MQDSWMHKVSENSGATHRMLGIPKGTNIPFTFLEVIRETPIGKIAENPTKTGKASVKVTLLLKQRCMAALNMKRVTKRRYG